MPPAHKAILLVDDDNEIIESMRTVLENKGYRILVARDGNAGLTIAERENPDLIVLDMMMPKKSGFLVLEKLKGRPGGLIPTIMITGNEGEPAPRLRRDARRPRLHPEALRDGETRQVRREDPRRAPGGRRRRPPLS